MIFTTISGDQYTILIDLQKLNDYSNFYNYVLEYLSNVDSHIKEKLDDSYIKYIYGNNNINSENYSEFINTNEITISIIFQDLPKIYSTDNAFAILTTNENIISWGCSELISEFNNIQSQLKYIKKICSTGLFMFLK